MRNIYIPVAIVFLTIFIITGFLLFVPRKVDNKEQIKIEVKDRFAEKNNNKKENRKEGNMDVFASETNDEPQFMMESSGVPRSDAASHRMDERYFKYFKFNDYDYMNKNMQERLTSLHNAQVIANKAKRGYTDVD